jgi:hypothetical protein
MKNTLITVVKVIFVLERIRTWRLHDSGLMAADKEQVKLDI